MEDNQKIIIEKGLANVVEYAFKAGFKCAADIAKDGSPALTDKEICELIEAGIKMTRKNFKVVEGKC